MLTKAVNQDSIKMLTDAYFEELSRYDIGLMMQAINYLIHNWTSQFNRIPSVADIVQQYKILKNSKSQKKQVENIKSINKNFNDKKNNTNRFWGKYGELRNRGMINISEILKEMRENA